MNKIIFEPCIYSRPLIDYITSSNNNAFGLYKNFVDLEIIKKGIAYARYYHGTQSRKSGEPYYSHPVAVAHILAKCKFETDIIVAGLLHDTLEDTDLTFDVIACAFNHNIAVLVEAVSRLHNHDTGRKYSVAEKLLESCTTGDLDALLIKSSDRVHNMLTLGSMKPAKQEEIRKETLEDIMALGFVDSMRASCDKLLAICKETR